MDHRNELREVLTTRRAGVIPHGAGVQACGGRRRIIPGPHRGSSGGAHHHASGRPQMAEMREYVSACHLGQPVRPISEFLKLRSRT